MENIRTAKLAEALTKPDADEKAVTRLLASKDILIDERPRSKGGLTFPLFAQVQPYVFTRPTFLSLLDVFEVFHKRGPSMDYSSEERKTIERLLNVVDRTPVMRRARAEAAKLVPSGLSDVEWHQHLWQIWFQRHPDSSRRREGIFFQNLAFAILFP